MNTNGISGLTSALLVAALLGASAAHGATVVAKGSKTILQNGSTTITLVTGNNPIDQPATFLCKSTNGCAVVMNAALQISINNDDVLCSTVDGTAGAPGCAFPGSSGFASQIYSTHQQLTVSQGSHTVATAVTASSGGDQITSWETDYAIYEIK